MVVAIGFPGWLMLYIPDNSMFVQYYESIHNMLLFTGLMVAGFLAYECMKACLTAPIQATRRIGLAAAGLVVLLFVLGSGVFAARNTEAKDQGYASILAAARPHVLEPFE